MREEFLYIDCRTKNYDMAVVTILKSYSPSVNTEEIRENQFLIIINTYFKNHSKTRTLFQELDHLQNRLEGIKKKLTYSFFLFFFFFLKQRT